MSPSLIKRSSGRAVVMAAALFAAAACGSSSTGSVGAIALTLNPSSASVQQGGTVTVTGTLTRSGGFTGDVTLSAEGVPTGVTATIDNVVITSGTSTATVTILVGAATPVGLSTITVRGKATGLTDATATFALTVTAMPSYTLQLTPAAVSIVQGGSTPTVSVDISRTNFTDAVTLSAGNLPAGVTAAFAPPAPTGNNSVLTLTVGAAVAPGVYNLTVNGTATAGNQSAQLTLTVTAAATPSFALSLSSAALTITQGGNTPTTTVNIARTNFTDAVTLSVSGLPAGATGAFVPPAPTGNSSVLTLTVGAAVTPGVYSLTVIGTPAVGNPQSTPLQLTVTVAPDFALSTTPAGSATVVQGANANVTVNVNRTGGFDDGVTLTATGQPAGLTVGFAPNPATTNSSVMTLTAAGGLAAGNYPIVVHGNASLGERTVNLTVTVTASSGSGNATVSFAACSAEDKAIWLAYQDGNSAWVRVVGVADVYQFNITQGKGGLAYVVLGSGTSQIQVLYFSQAEMTGATLNYCTTPPSGKTVNGTMANLGAGLQAMISFGGSSTSTFVNGPFQLTNVRDGTNDLVAYIRGLADVSATDKIFFSRGLNPANGGSVGTVDANSAVTVGSGFMTLVGGAGGETVMQSMSYSTGAACTVAPLYSTAVSAPPSFYAYGAPAGQPSSDMHNLTVSAIAAGSGIIRSVTESFHAMAARNITLPSLLAIPTVSDAGGPYKRPMVVTTLPADLNSQAMFTYADQTATGKTGVLSATAAWLGGLSVSLTLPDFSALSGWSNAWAPATGDALQWSFSGTGINLTSLCEEGGRAAFSTRSGTM